MIPESSGSLYIISIDQICTLIHQLPPNTIPRTYRPAWLIPIPNHDTFAVCCFYLSAEKGELSAVEGGPWHGSKVGEEVG